MAIKAIILHDASDDRYELRVDIHKDGTVSFDIGDGDESIIAVTIAHDELKELIDWLMKNHPKLK